MGKSWKNFLRAGLPMLGRKRSKSGALKMISKGGTIDARFVKKLTFHTLLFILI